MVQPLVRLQVHRVEHLVDPLALGPVEVPVGVAVRLLPASCGHHIIYSIGEGRPKFNGRAAAGHLVVVFVIVAARRLACVECSRARWVLGSFWFDCSVSFFGREALVALQALVALGDWQFWLVPGPLLLLDSFENRAAGQVELAGL